MIHSRDYEEQLITQKPKIPVRLFRICCLVAGIEFLILGLIAHMIFLIGVPAVLIICLVISPKLQNEFEYTCIDDELRIDRIRAKRRRKHIGSYSFSQMEIVAPKNSRELESQSRRNGIRIIDCSSAIKDHENSIYGFVAVNGSHRDLIYIEPNETMLKRLRSRTASRFIPSQHLR